MCTKIGTQNYYFDQVTSMLESLDEFLKRTEPEIESITGEERNTASFMKMMRLFNEVCVNIYVQKLKSQVSLLTHPNY